MAVSSCGKIEDQFNEINAELDSITARLDALEAALNADVANLATLDASHKALDKAVKDLEAALEAAIAAGDKTNSDGIKALQEQVATLQAQLAGVKLEAKDGTVVVTIGESSFTLSKNGVLTIVEVDGVKYWALVDPATGEATNLNVKVGHDLKFKVDPETAEVLVCYDGDKYVGTGVYAAESSATLIGDVEETDEYVTITIGDATYTLEKWADDKSVLGLSRADFFLMYGAEKVVELTAEDIAEYYVMAKPDGWKATLEGKTLTVVAPAKKAYEVGAAETKGEILIHATTVEGKCKVAKIDVKTGDGLTLKVDSEGNLYIENAFVGTTGNAETGYAENFLDFKFGIAPAAEFYAMASNYEYMFGTTDPFEGFEKAFNAYDYAAVGQELGFYNWYGYRDTPATPYKEGEYEVDKIEASIFDLYSDVFYEELPYGPYIIWAASYDEKGLVGGIRFAEFNYVNVEIELVKATYNDLIVKVNVDGADEYMIGWVAESETMQSGGGIGPLAAGIEDFTAFDEYMLGTRGPWTMFVENGVPYYLSPAWGQQMPADYVTTMFPEEGASLKSYDPYGDPLAFNEKYYFWVMPMYSHMTKFDESMYSYDFSAYDYETHFKPYLVSFTTNDIQSEGSVTPAITFTEESWTSLSVDVDAEGADMVYYALFSDDEYTDFVSDDEIVETVIANCEWPESGSFSYEFDRDLNYVELVSGSKYHLAVVAIDADGKYVLASKAAVTKSVPATVNEAYTVTFGTITSDFDEVTVDVTPSAVGTTYYKYYDKDEYDSMEESEVLMDVLLDENILTEQGGVVKSYASPQHTYVLAVVVLGEDGTDYNVLSKDCATKSYPYSADVKVTLKSLTSSAENQYTAVFTVEGADNVMYQIGSAGQSSSFPMNVVKYAPTQDEYYGSYGYASVVNGEVEISFESSTVFYYYSSDLYIAAYNVENNAVASMSEVLTFAVASKYAELNPTQN